MTNQDKPSLAMETNSIFFDVEANDQKEVFTKLAAATKELKFIRKERKLVKAFFKREQEASTGFGDGFAIPHAQNRDIKKAGIFFMRLKNGVEWNALDNQPVKFVIALLVPKKETSNLHMELLSTVAQNILKPHVQQLLTTSTDKTEIVKGLVG